jgi:hypothetical protein
MLLVLSSLFFGCVSLWELSEPVGYETQKRIVWQGTLVMGSASGVAAPTPAIYFGYDRNRDYARNNHAIPCKGVDLIEYKRLYPDGHWDYNPFLILSDENNDCYIDNGWLDCNADGILETVVALPSNSVKLEAVDGKYIGNLKSQCR